MDSLARPRWRCTPMDASSFVNRPANYVCIKNNVVLPAPFTTLTVNSSGERGLLGVTFDPNYATNRFVYVYYTATTPTIHNRVSRFTANAANEDVARSRQRGRTSRSGDSRRDQPQRRRNPFWS